MLGGTVPKLARATVPVHFPKMLGGTVPKLARATVPVHFPTMLGGTVPKLANVELELLTEAAVQQLQLLAALQQLLYIKHMRL